MEIKKKIKFLKLVSKMATNREFERVLEMSPIQVLDAKKELGIVSENDARLLAKKLEKEIDSNASSIKPKPKPKPVPAPKKKPKPKKKAVNVVAMKNKAAEQQRKWLKHQAEMEKPSEEWRLPSDTSPEQFSRDIRNRGLKFCGIKYGASAAQIKFEAKRLKLDIRWENIR